MPPNCESTLRLSTAVRDVQTGDGAVLLDIQQCLCLSMTPIAAKIWQMLKLDRSPSEIVNSLSAEFPVIPKGQIHDDVMKFVAELKHKGLLISGVPVQKPKPLDRFLCRIKLWSRVREGTQIKPGSPRLLFWKALLGLLAFDLFRFGKDFTRTHSLVQSWSIARIPGSASTVDLICKAVNYACVWYPKRVLCLQRSAVTTCLLRNCGTKAQMVVGAQKFPFEAHAWTEVDGRVINERRDVRSIYMVWERC